MDAQEIEEQQPPMSAHEVEKAEEMKLKSKYPGTVGASAAERPLPAHSLFLQKRLAKGQKFFDSGDYQMAKQKSGSGKFPVKATILEHGYTAGEAIPTPETVPVRKTSIVQQSKFTHNVM